MPVCKNDKLKHYKGNEPSPKGRGYCAHAEKIGTIKKGLDGNKWIITKTSTGSLRWTKLKTKSKSFKKPTSIMKTSAKKHPTKSNRTKNNCKKVVIYEKSGFFTGYSRLIGLEGDVKGTIHKYISYNNFDPIATEIPSGYTKSKYKNGKFFNELVKNNYCDNDDTKIYPTDDIYKNITKVGKRYFILDNGGYTAMVHINSNIVSVYRYKGTGDDDDTKYIKLIKQYKPLKLYVGNSYLSEMSKYSHGPKYDGNSILLKINKNTYVFIGESVYEFNVSDDDIVEYYSTVANDDVPYPIAIGKKNIYFMIGKKYISIDKFKQLLNITSIPNNIKYDLHAYYYDINDVNKSSKKFKKVKTVLKRFNI